jgi:hypothetical protein
MKRVYLSLLSLAISCASFAQGDATYKGAIKPNAGLSADWTLGWANWNPDQTDYPVTNDDMFNTSGKVTVITTTVTLDPAKVYLLTNLVVVENGGKLIIPAGTVIRGEANKANNQYATIFVNRGGRIESNGTKQSPVVFTSNSDKGSRAPEDWGGIVICGNATSNQAAGAKFEAAPLIPSVLYSNAEFGVYGGGANPTENSTTITYTRIEFPGLDYTADKEVNGLTLCALGSGSTLNNIMVYQSGDDAFEWFGGTANASHLIAVGAVDDDFDTDHGFSGNVEYGISVKDINLYISDANGGSNSANTFESDNDGSGNDIYPKTSAKFYNITSVGPIPAGKTYNDGIFTANANLKKAWVRAALIRRNTQISILNSVFYGWPTAIDLNDNKTLRNAGIVNLAGAVASYKSLVESSEDTLKIMNNDFRGVSAGLQTAGFNKNAFVATIGNTETTYEKTDSIASFLLKGFNSNRKIDTLGAYFINNGAPFAPSFLPDTAKPTGLEELSLSGEQASVYPNPSNGNFEVSFTLSETENVLVQVLNNLGQVVLVRDEKLLAGNNNVSFSGVESGLYFVKVSTNNSSTVVRLLVK